MSESDKILDEARAWLSARWDAVARHPSAGEDRQAWLDAVFSAGWAAPSWPLDWWGHGADEQTARRIGDAFGAVGAPGGHQERTNIAGAVLMRFGADQARRTVIPDLFTGRKTFCLLYSEPGAGSDLASVRCRADKDGDRYRVTGQKVWTSGAHSADFGLLLARTDWDQPKHKGLTFFILDMRQPGVEVRPINQITGDSHFAETFLNDAVVPESFRVGHEGEGWSVMQAALGVERLMMGEGAGERRQGSRSTQSVDLVQVARETGAIADPVIRQALAQAIAYRELNALTMARAKAESRPGAPSSLGLTGKLAMSRILHEDARVMARMLGARSMLNGVGDPLAHDANYRAANAYMTSIGGGTDQIQRNIIGERLLGLPREIELDRDVPFRLSRAVLG